jgi:hypothetical protein
MLKTVYIGCALQTASPELVQFVHQLTHELEMVGFEILTFVGTNPSIPAKEVYERDSDCVARADIMVAICDLPSTGLGMEIMQRIQLGAQTIICYKSTVGISRMVLGASEVYKNTLHTIAYEDVSDIVNEVTRFV